MVSGFHSSLRLWVYITGQATRTEQTAQLLGAADWNQNDSEQEFKFCLRQLKRKVQGMTCRASALSTAELIAAGNLNVTGSLTHLLTLR